MSFASKVFDVFLPPLCLACDAAVTGHGTLCPACWSGIHFIAAPFCASCGAPFDTPVGDGELCAGCLIQPPIFANARSAMLYDDASKRLILSFKHGDRTHLAGTLAGWLHRAGQEFWEDADCILPVPLHRWRLFKRRYNQAALLAQIVALKANKPVLPDALRRHKATPSQGRMNRKERHANVKGAFSVHPKAAEMIREKSLILIDDVLTTGATLNECSHVLMEAGARQVRVLTLARVKGLI